MDPGIFKGPKPLGVFFTKSFSSQVGQPKKLMDKKGYTWDTVVGAFEKAGQTEEDALVNARLAYILQHKDYDNDTKKINLWNPSK